MSAASVRPTDERVRAWLDRIARGALPTARVPADIARHLKGSGFIEAFRGRNPNVHRAQIEHLRITEAGRAALQQPLVDPVAKIA